MQYDHKKVEKKWQKEWEKSGIYKTPDEKKGADNFYALVEFPYPSGNLHTGHWYAFSVPDIFARKKRMEGRNVLFPIGFDAFGLPAENAAIKRKINPKKWTYENIDYMRKQIRSMGASFDWSREVITCDPEYYKWTQWIFLQFFKKGLAYQAETPVNWCPKDKTVLANEQVVGGCCERCGAEIEQKNMKQWMLKITDYAERLLSGLEKLPWKEEIKEAQRNWIGKSEGAEIEFPILWTSDVHSMLDVPKVKVFTTRPDTLFGATYLVLAPEHEAIQKLKTKIQNLTDVEKYIAQAKKKTQLQRQKEEKGKTGIELKGIKAINSANQEEIPIWISDYVLLGYGTGAIMAVPAHDQRDFEFAKKFKLPVKMVICPNYPDPTCPAILDKVYEGKGSLVDSGKFDGMDSEKAKGEITKFVGGKIKAEYRLRDWVVSRQRYWGVPIPITHCKKCGPQAVPEKELPVKLPEVKNYLPTGEGKSPLAKATKWLKIKCPKCGVAAERETDTLDTFVDSSWYFLRYCDSENANAFAEKAKIENWLPVDLYSGGAEHTTMHLLYSRFFYKAMYDCGLLGGLAAKRGDEIASRPPGDEPYLERRNRGIILGPDWQKMSKSKGNVVDPDEYVAKFGADTVRMYLAFIGPYNEVGSYPWDPHGILGIKRFLDRAWKLAHGKTSPSGKKPGFLGFLKPGFEELGDVGEGASLERLLHKTIKQVSENIDEFKFNTAISALMILLNEMEKQPYAISHTPYGLGLTAYGVFLKLLAPFAPHLTEEIWQKMNKSAKGGPASGWQSIHLEPWPKYDPKLMEEAVFELIVQVNGKVRDKFEAPINILEAEAEHLTLAREKVKIALENKKPRRVVFVPKRLINLVV